MRASDVIDEFLAAPEVNAQFKDHLNGWSADRIAKAITHFAFRNGPVEDMHASPNSQLSDDDMKTLNKFMHNRLTYVVELVLNERWVELAVLLDLYKYSGSGWDPAEPDDGGIRDILTTEYEEHRRQTKRNGSRHKPAKRRAVSPHEGGSVPTVPK